MKFTPDKSAMFRLLAVFVGGLRVGQFLTRKMTRQSGRASPAAAPIAPAP